MAGYNTRNTITKDTPVTSGDTTSWLKVSENDLQGIVFIIKSTDDLVPTFETSFDGGESVETVAATATLLTSGKRKYEINTQPDPSGTPAPGTILGPLVRAKFAPEAPETLEEFWVTRRT